MLVGVTNLPLAYTDSYSEVIAFKWVRGELIGRGSFASVYMALNATTGEMVAVKQVDVPRSQHDLEGSREGIMIDAIRKENRTLQQLYHPHIVEYLGYEETPTIFSV